MSGIISVSPDMQSGIVGKFPTGQVLQVVRGVYKTQTSITSSTKIIDVELTAKGGSSTFFGHWSMQAGTSLDAEGFRVSMTISTAVPSNSTTASQMWEMTSPGDIQNYVFRYDLGNVTSSIANEYTIDHFSGTVQNLPVIANSTFAKGATVHCAMWVQGESTLYINRCKARVGANETGITSLTVWEIAT